MTSFYDWYADLPVASPQVFGDQTDVPESGDWWDAAYLMMWGSNVPITRTPDAHWMAEARYRGTKVVTVSPDYADNTKFADEWMPCAAGTDGALAMAMGHVILSECYVRKQVPFFADFARRYTDLPFLIKLEQRGEMLVPGKNLTAADLGEADKNSENAALKPAVLDETTGTVVVPHGSLGFRYGEDGVGKWNLDLGDLLPALSVQGAEATNGDRRTALVHLPSFDTVNGEGATVARGVPVRRVGKHLVCTVFDLMLAHYGVARAGLPGQWPTGYDDPTQPNTPAWQEPITGVSAAQAIRVAREFARSAEESGGRSMIIMGGGICHWFHGDAIYRAVLALLMLTGSMGRNGGGWAHYVGQEKIRPLTGFQTMSMATDWVRPPRQVPGASYWYAHADQWRYDGYGADKLASPVGRGRFTDKHTMDVLASAVAMGWSPYYPQFDRSSLDLADEAHEAGRDAGEYVAQQLAQRKLKLAVTDPDNPVNWPRVLTVWRANLIGSSGKGGEYFLRHLLGTDSNVQAAPPRDGIRPVDVACEGDIPEGKLDLMMSIDFRMTSTTLVSDVVLPAATWYEKADISSTDMHPYVHAFSAATDPPWETRSDFDAFAAIARAFSAMAKGHLGTRSDVVLTALQHDTPDAMTFPGGAENDWLHTGATPVPGRTMGKITVVERDYTAIYDKWLTLGPLVEKFGLTTKGVTVHPFQEVQELAARFGVLNSGAAAGRPAITTAARMADVLLLLSGTTNGRLAVEGFRELEKRTGQRLAHLAEGSEDRRISYADTQARPVPVITSPEWSGSETGGRRYAPFTINIENLKPFHTLTGRMHFYLAHDWIEELGEHLPVFRPPLDMARLFGHPELSSRSGDGIGLTVRYLTPHSKWSFHSTYQDNLYMLSLSRGGPTMWMSPGDAAKIQVRDNDWVEAVNANGIYVCRAIVSHRIPDGVVFVYHVQERTVDTPRTETNNKRGGNHNALTRIRIKPSHLAGGYGQHAFAFNYLGPTGNQRDEVTVVRRRSQEVRYQ
ncbi:nitrate reductase, alpha subunit [Mycobacterium kansasii]|nr:nitrate reductase, alpha subunit [Mycobacterium kansasii]